MNKLDEYWFWVTKAISDPSIDNLYFYDNQKDELFGLNMVGNQLTPIYRNKTTERLKEVSKSFSEAIDKIKNLDGAIQQLPRLSFNEKKDFFVQFISTIEDPFIKARLNSEIDQFSEIDNFNFKTNLKQIDFNLALLYEQIKAQFIAYKVKELLEPLGISEKSTVLW